MENYFEARYCMLKQNTMFCVICLLQQIIMKANQENSRPKQVKSSLFYQTLKVRRKESVKRPFGHLSQLHLPV